jgi:hypothetical protein
MNYLKSVDLDFYNEIVYIQQSARSRTQINKLSNYRKAYLRVYFKALVAEKQIYFNGVI